MAVLVPRIYLGLIAQFLVSLAGCGAGSSASAPTPAPTITSALNDSPGFLHDPSIALVLSPQFGDLSVAYTHADLRQQVHADYVSEQWEKMKTCLNVSAEPPIVLVIDGWIDAVESDDVLFNIIGRRLATSTHRPEATNLVRISSYDFDGSQGNPGFHLRSILGRYLWAVNELSAVGYNTGCASQT